MLENVTVGGASPQNTKMEKLVPVKQLMLRLFEYRGPTL